MKLMLLLFLTFLLFFLPALPNTSDTPVIDGNVIESIWKTARRITLQNGGELLVLKQENTLWLALMNNKKSWAHVYVAAGDSIRILHASAALGEALFIKKGKTWESFNTFQWEMRDKVYSEELKTKQDNYFRQHGWVANNNNMNNGMCFEFRISLPTHHDQQSFAFVILEDPNNPHYYPLDLKDDVLSPKLLQGYNTGPLVFDLTGWDKL